MSDNIQITEHTETAAALADFRQWYESAVFAEEARKEAIKAAERAHVEAMQQQQLAPIDQFIALMQQAEAAERQREIESATLVSAAVEALAFLRARHPDELVTLKLAAAIERMKAQNLEIVS